jgi:hypothetical protein
MENSYIVRQMVNGIVFYVIPGEVRERTWPKKDSRHRVPFEELEKCVFDPRTKSLFERGFLFIEDKDCRIQLGLEQPDPTLVNENKLILEKDDIVALLYDNDFKVFKDKVEKLAEGSIEILLETAVNSNKQLSIDKSEYIREKYHIDIVMIQRQRREDEKSVTKEG